MNSTQKTIILLIKSALYNTKVIIPVDFDWEAAKNIIYRHNIIGLIYFGLYNSGIDIPEWLSVKFYSRVISLENLWHKGDEIREKFDEEKIDYVLLKGILLKDLYSSPYMRDMSDVDILIREKDYPKIKPIMKKLGYKKGVESNHELQWTKGGQLIELHKKIIPSYNIDFYKVINDGWEWIKEHEYAYVFTHFAKHYRDSGIGISHLVDLEILHNQATDNGLQELHLDKFYDNVQRTLDCWFRDKEFDDITTRITETIFKSGEYGAYEVSVKAKALKKINAAHGNAKIARKKDFLHLMFPPLSEMKSSNPILNKFSILLPIVWVWRIIRSPFSGNIKKLYKENKAITSGDKRYQEELNAVGLDFWF